MDPAKISIQQINPEETFSIRQKILRLGRPVEESQFDGDSAATTIHLGAFLEENLLGIATFVKKNNLYFPEPAQYQLRGMAVLPEFQNMQVGQKLLLSGEDLLKVQKGITLIWCNARETAVEFYKKSRYETFGDYFEIPGICRHIVMYKNL